MNVDNFFDFQFLTFVVNDWSKTRKAKELQVNMQLGLIIRYHLQQFDPAHQTLWIHLDENLLRQKKAITILEINILGFNILDLNHGLQE